MATLTSQSALREKVILSAPKLAERIYSVDLLRGVVMVIMALDHVRDITSGLPFTPEDLARTWPA